MVSNNGFALLVGVDDYSSFGSGFNLKGSRQDVLKLYWFARQILGLSPENIRVLASPPLTASEFYMTSAPPTGMMGEATQGPIQAGIQWLAERLGQNASAPGLFTFSGHGSYAPDRGPLLCPADVGRDLAKAIAVRDLSKSETLQKISDRLTVVLDCCHVAPAAPAPNLRVPTALPHDATPEQIAADHADFDISERVLLAARPGQHAHQAVLGKVWHGALTFALVTVAEQWKASQDPGTPGLHVSYAQLLKRVRKLLSALRMRQNTRLRVPLAKRKTIRALPFFGTQAGLTTRKPDAERDTIQVDAGQKDYRFYIVEQVQNGATVQVAYVLSVNPNSSNPPANYSPGMEYWQLIASVLNTVPLTFQCPDGDQSSPLGLPSGVESFSPKYQASVDPSWTPSWATPATFYWSPDGQKYLTLAWDVNPSNSVCAINWYTSASNTDAQALCQEAFNPPNQQTPTTFYSSSNPPAVPLPQPPKGSQVSTWTAYGKGLKGYSPSS